MGGEILQIKHRIEFCRFLAVLTAGFLKLKLKNIMWIVPLIS